MVLLSCLLWKEHAIVNFSTGGHYKWWNFSLLAVLPQTALTMSPGGPSGENFSRVVGNTTFQHTVKLLSKMWYQLHPHQQLCVSTSPYHQPLLVSDFSFYLLDVCAVFFWIGISFISSYFFLLFLLPSCFLSFFSFLQFSWLFTLPYGFGISLSSSSKKTC